MRYTQIRTPSRVCHLKRPTIGTQYHYPYPQTLQKHNSSAALASSSSSASSINWISPDTIRNERDINHFRKNYFQPEKPVVLRSAEHLCRALPAYMKWFVETDNNNNHEHEHEHKHGNRIVSKNGENKGPSRRIRLNYEYLSKFGNAIVPLELTRHSSSLSPETKSEGAGEEEHEAQNIQFERFQAPLSIFLEWTRTVEQQQQQDESSSTNPNNHNTQQTQIYLAQAHLIDLPTELTSDFHPTPDLITQSGRNDIYATNLWIGLPPTYTPLHKDPNPNLFLQLAGYKHIRVLEPGDGMRVFMDVKGRLRQMQEQQQQQKGTVTVGSSSSFRGNEMMQGAERRLLEEAVWGDLNMSSSSPSTPQPDLSTVSQNTPKRIGYDVILERGDALFIPKGWWHSIKGVGKEITASVNWWFR